MVAMTAAAMLVGTAKALQFINIVAGYLKLAAEVGADITPFVGFIQRISATQTVTQADVDELHAMSKPYLDLLNDTSRDRS